MTGMSLSHEVEIVSSEAALAQPKYSSGIYVHGLKKIMKTRRIFGIRAQVPIEHLLIVSLECYSYTNPVVDTNTIVRGYGSEKEPIAGSCEHGIYM
jgi:hypothetical protein